MRGFDDFRMLGQAKIIVGAHVEDALAASDLDMRVLRRGDDALVLVGARRANFCELAEEVIAKSVLHIPKKICRCRIASEKIRKVEALNATESRAVVIPAPWPIRVGWQ